ncbi:MAG: hypothetical protein EXR75_08620 [Myxococcales bacterium]|nr:hypothetical protein [Myxococcales bacterium]
MRSKSKFLASGFLAALGSCWLAEGDAHAQIPPLVERDPNWDAVSQVMLGIGAGTVALMPRVYYSSPAATVGWKARWHVSALAPIMTMTTLTLLVDGPLHDEMQGAKQGCSVEETFAALPQSGCEAFGSPSTHAFASWGATGAGLGVFLVDTVKHSRGEFSVPSFVGNVGVPLTTSILASVARSADGSGLGPEDTDQVLGGALAGAGIGLLVGAGYAFLQEPDCGYGNYLFCW